MASIQRTLEAHAGDAEIEIILVFERRIAWLDINRNRIAALLEIGFAENLIDFR